MVQKIGFLQELILTVLTTKWQTTMEIIEQFPAKEYRTWRKHNSIYQALKRLENNEFIEMKKVTIVPTIRGNQTRAYWRLKNNAQ